MDLAGQRFGRLTVLSLDSPGARARWLCACDCGTARIVRQYDLRSGVTLSCGCFHRDQMALQRESRPACSITGCGRPLRARGWCATHYARWEKTGDPLIIRARPSKHGLESHPLYPTWHTMMARCYHSQFSAYRFYGARGITVCERWHDVTSFIADMSPRPAGHSLDRKENDGPYSPDNCRWATAAHQAQNKRSNTVDEAKAREIRSLCAAGMTQKAVAERLGLPKGTVHSIARGATWVGI